MSRKVLILGAAGVFGSRICQALVKANIPVVIAGRQRASLEALQQSIRASYPNAAIEIYAFDIQQGLSNHLQRCAPFIVINTCGPFQLSDYSVAEACIALGIHYIDLADGRQFVCQIDTLDQAAKQHNCAVISGASTVPGLSSAVLEHYQHEFSSIESLRYGISPGQKAPRGLATTQAILSYLGKPLAPFVGTEHRSAIGWQDLYRQKYPELGHRWMANCDVPDLDLLPKRYGITTSIRFSAGMESAALHLGMWALSWVIRSGFPISLLRYAKTLLRISHWFDGLGTSDGGMHMTICGKDANHQPKTVNWFIIIKNGDGPQVPTIPAIVLTKKLLADQFLLRGAMPCVGLVSLPEYLAELKGFDVTTHERIQS